MRPLSFLQDQLDSSLQKSTHFLQNLSPARSLIGHAVIQWSFVKTRAFESALHQCEYIQRTLLRRILTQISDSEIFRHYGLHTQMTPSVFRKTAPVFDYETLEPYILRVLMGEKSVLFNNSVNIRMVATTSGTTNSPKLIPVTDQCLFNLKKSWLTWAYYMGQQHPGIAANRVLSLPGSFQISEQYGIPIGSITSFLSQAVAGSTKLAQVLPGEVSTIDSHETRQYLALRLGLNTPNIRLLITANPSTLIRLAERIKTDQDLLIKDLYDGTTEGIHKLPKMIVKKYDHLFRHKDKKRAQYLSKISAKNFLKPLHIWPQLELLATWTGGHATHYLQQIKDLYGGLTVRDHGLSATEGHMTIPTADETDHGILNISSAFFEFIRFSDLKASVHDDENKKIIGEKTLFPTELITGDRYEIVLTTFGGLLRYRMHDLVECVGYRGQTPILRFISKTNFFANIAGEKLSLWQVKDAFLKLEQQIKFHIGEYLLSATFRPQPLYICYIEEKFTSQQLPYQKKPSLDKWGRLLDDLLQQINMEYRDKRLSKRLDCIRFVTITKGAFTEMRNHRLKLQVQHAEQYKHPFLIQDPTIDAFLWDRRVTSLEHSKIGE